jgi:hypothetical protein
MLEVANRKRTLVLTLDYNSYVCRYGICDSAAPLFLGRAGVRELTGAESIRMIRAHGTLQVLRR